MPAQKIEEAVSELYHWARGNEPTNFTALLYTLIAKADSENYASLKLASPLEVQAYESWRMSMDENEFFREWGIIR